MTESKSKEEVVYPDVHQYLEIKPYNKHSATVIFLHVFIHISLAGIRSNLVVICIFRDWEIVANWQWYASTRRSQFEMGVFKGSWSYQVHTPICVS